MPNSHPIPLRNNPSLSAAATRSVHYDLVANALPGWLTNTSVPRLNALKSVTLTLPDWHKSAAPAAHRRLKDDMEQHWTAQNKVDKALGDLQDVYAFAKPLLQLALKKRFGIEDDVEQIWLRLYAPVTSPWWVHDFGAGIKSRTVSLLDAALHNFSRDETFIADSQFISRPDARGQFDVIRLKHKMSVDEFKALCRELDIGARYERHLNDFLLSTDSMVRSVLRHKIIASQKSALRVAARMALMKGDIGQDTCNVVQALLEGAAQLRWKGQAVICNNLSMMDVALTGIVLITADVEHATSPAPVIVYIPNDPQHPLKEYSSPLAFIDELTRKLRDTSAPTPYQQFFSQFVAHQQRGHFFAGLNDRLSKVKWQPVPPGSGLPSWREMAVDKPLLHFSLMKIQDDRKTRFTGDSWLYFYEQKLNKILNDAREIAISTEYADRMARWAWWDNLEKILSDIFNAALMVAMPFVPGLGELMLVYTAWQLTDEVVEGIVDLAQGRLAEAGEQAIAVLESVVQLGAFAAGATLGNLARARLSPFFEGLKPVQLTDGSTRLWNPDLAPYQQPELAPPADARRDHTGIFQHQDKRILRLDDQHFEVKVNPVSGQQRIQHPRRAGAYTPSVIHNGHGAWVSETETPRRWEGTTLMRRIGHAADGFSDDQLAQIRLISGTDESHLRRMYVDNSAPPPLLIDTLQRLGSPVTAVEGDASQITLLFADFPELPDNIAQKILASATTAERQQIAQNNRLPLRLSTRARELQFEVNAVRAAQGLYHDALANIDTERLVLGALRNNTDTFGNLRLEIRQGVFDGELRCSAGAEDSTEVRLLVRTEAGRYEVRDGLDQLLHEADGLLPATLHAIGTDGRNALGYGVSDTEHFREWLIAKTAPPSERRTVLATPPVRQVPEHETMLLVRGGGLSKEGETLQERIRDLYPHFSESEVLAFANALSEGVEPLQAIDAHEDELDDLRTILKRWEYEQPEYWGPDVRGFLNGGGKHIAERLVDCFKRKNTELGARTNPEAYSLDLSRELLPLDLETWWKQRPELKKFLDKVTVLKLDNTRFSVEPNGLLKAFPNLRELSAQRCELTSIPWAIDNLQGLERLRLSDNHIVLDEPAVVRLKNLTRLEILRLEDNPLQRLPNIERMPRLKVVALKNTGLRTWPEGTLAKPRPRGFVMDLRENPISVIPDVVPGSPQALVIARTRLDVATLSDVNQVNYQAIRRSMALPAEPLVPLNNAIDLSITSNYSDALWNDVPGWGIDRANLWAQLSDEPNSQRFMTVLLKAKNSADYRAGGAARDQLLNRIWRMMDAAQIDTKLREKLFTMAISPVDCADAGAQLFNNMGIHVLASEAYSFSTNAAQLERQLVTLARGAARLEHVNDVAHDDVRARNGNPDEVEVYLAYQTGLADRLDLPWQSRGMLYRPVSGVTEEMIDQAYDLVLELEENDGLVNKMLEQQFWQDYLGKTYPQHVAQNTQRFQVKQGQLLTLHEVQKQWATAQLTIAERDAMRQELQVLVQDLPVSEEIAFADTPMSKATYDRLQNDQGYQENQLFRQWTREALARAGLTH